MVVVPTLQVGGAERCTSILLRHLSRISFEIALVQIFDRKAFFQPPSDVNIFVLETILEPYVDRLEITSELHKKYKKELLWFESVARRLALKIREWHPTVVFAQDVFASVIVLLAKALSRENVRVVASAHSLHSIFLDLTPQSQLIKILIRGYLNQADRIVAVSEDVKRDLILNFGITSGLVSVVNNPVEVSEIMRLSKEELSDEWPEGAPVVLHVGNLTTQKRLSDLLQAIALARRTRELRLAIIGAGPEEPALRRLALNLGIDEDVVFMGEKVNPYKYMRMAACLVVCSQVEAWLPYSALEAMACGCPVVTTESAPGICEIDAVKHVPRGNPTWIADGILEILDSPSLRSELVQKAQKFVQDLDPKVTVSKYESLIQSLMKAEGA